MSDEMTEVLDQLERDRRSGALAECVRRRSSVLYGSNAAGEIISEHRDTQASSCKVSLPYSEADLLAGLDVKGSHGDELAKPSLNEIDGEDSTPS